MRGRFYVGPLHKNLPSPLDFVEGRPVREIVPWLIGLLPFLTLTLILYWEYESRKRRLKQPFTKFLLRPPGESLRLRIESLDEHITERLLCLIISGILAALLIKSLWNHAAIVVGIALAFLAGSGFFALCLRRSIHLRRNCYLGFLGERAVGEELSQLPNEGWRVFHDVEFTARPGAKPFNVDHVVVGPGGVFAIETKTRRKQLGGKPNVVVFDGHILHFPWGSEDFGLRNAVDRATHLAQWLSDALDHPVSVQPVLAMPGWSVKRNAKGATAVVSGGEIAGYFRSVEKGRKLDPRSVAAVCGLLDQKCRDVGD